MQERLEQSVNVLSNQLAVKFSVTIQFMLHKIQDACFAEAEKPPCTTDSYIACALHRFDAAQVAIEGRVDRGDGDTLFSQVFRKMKEAQPSDWRQYWIKDGSDRNSGNRVFRANF